MNHFFRLIKFTIVNINYENIALVERINYLLQFWTIFPRPVDATHVAPLDIDGGRVVDVAAPLAGSQLAFDVQAEHLVLEWPKSFRTYIFKLTFRNSKELAIEANILTANSASDLYFCSLKSITHICWETMCLSKVWEHKWPNRA